MELGFQIEMWAAVAPGIDQQEDWKLWLTDPQPLDDSLSPRSLKRIPPLLRRRFNTLGKCAIGAALKLMEGGNTMPSVFASRYGDSALSFSLLDDMGRDIPMSPTSFSLAVHNAISGLYSIARNDTSAVTAIASMEGLVIHALLETLGQLQATNRVLCIVYDMPLPETYGNSTSNVPFPYAIAMVLNRSQGKSYILEQCIDSTSTNEPLGINASETLQFLELLTGLSDEVRVESNGMFWAIKTKSS